MATNLEGSDMLEMCPEHETLNPLKVKYRYRKWQKAASAALGHCMKHIDMTPVRLSEDGEEPATWRDVALPIEQAGTQACRGFTRGEPTPSHDGGEYITTRQEQAMLNAQDARRITKKNSPRQKACDARLAIYMDKIEQAANNGESSARLTDADRADSTDDAVFDHLRWLDFRIMPKDGAYYACW